MLIESVLHDLRYSVRGFGRAPLFACVVAGTIGLGLGIVSSVFSLFNAYVLRPYAVRDAYSLYELSWDTATTRRHQFTWREFESLRSQNSVFSDVFASQVVQVTLDGRKVSGELVTGGYFSMLGVEALLGRTLLPEDATEPGARAVVVLTHDGWKARFAGDPAIIGRTITVVGHPYEVIGVAAPDFGGLTDVSLDFWAPLTMSRALTGGPDLFGPAQPHVLHVVGRLESDLSVEQARARLEVLSRQITQGPGDDERPVMVRLESRATRIPLSPGVLATFSVVLAAFGLVLLIACANVANMMLARGAARQREIAVRLSLGASRARLVRQLVTESFMLAVPAAVIAFVITSAATRLVPYLAVTTLPSGAVEAMSGLIVPLDPDLRVLVFLLVAASVSATLFGLAPALQTTRISLANAARGEYSDQARPSRLRNSLVVAQVMACVLFLVSATGLLRGVQRLARQDTGLDANPVADARVPDALRHHVAERLASEPLIETVAVAWRPPLYGPLRTLPVTPSGSSEQVQVGYNFVSAEYFDVFRIPLTRGRSFTKEEGDAKAPVAIVSERTARRLWPGQDPLDQTLHIVPASVDRPHPKAPPYSSARVIGIVGDVVSGLVLDGMDSTSVYFPIGFAAEGGASVLIRSRADAGSIRAAFDAAVTSAGGDVGRQLFLMREVLAFQVWPLQALGWIASLLGVIALVLALTGTYGVVSYLVSRRTREFGIRMALGATAGVIVTSVLRQSLRLAVVGVAAGAVLAIGLSRLMAASLDMIPAFDPYAYIAGALVVFVATAAAAYIPSRNAARADPATALRHD